MLIECKSPSWNDQSEKSKFTLRYKKQFRLRVQPFQLFRAPSASSSFHKLNNLLSRKHTRNLESPEDMRDIEIEERKIFLNVVQYKA